MADFENEILELNKKSVNEAKLQEQEAKRQQKEERKAQMAEKREEIKESIKEASSKVADAVKAPFIAIKEGIANAHQARVEAKVEKERQAEEAKILEQNQRERYQDYLKLCENSRDKVGTVEKEKNEDGSEKTVLYTEQGVLIKNSLKKEDYKKLDRTVTKGERDEELKDIRNYTSHVLHGEDKDVCPEKVSYEGFFKGEDFNYKYVNLSTQRNLVYESYFEPGPYAAQWAFYVDDGYKNTQGCVINPSNSKLDAPTDDMSASVVGQFEKLEQAMLAAKTPDEE